MKDRPDNLSTPLYETCKNLPDNIFEKCVEIIEKTFLREKLITVLQFRSLTNTKKEMPADLAMLAKNIAGNSSILNSDHKQEMLRILTLVDAH